MSYIASLNLLNTDSPAPPSEDTFSDDLSLWANAQFTFDSAPGSALLEDDKKEENEKLFASLTDFTLDNQQQQQQQQQQDEPTNYLSSDYLLSQLQQHAPITPTTPLTPTHIGLPRLAPAPTDQQLQHQLQNHHHHEHYLNTMTTPNSHVNKDGSNNNSNSNNKRSLNDDDQDPARSTGANAVEDDKRRRNTAASARFRQKKKLREQALEQTAKEMSTKCEALDKRVRELEMEAKWLRALVVEKNPSLLADRSDASEKADTNDSAATTKNS
ncbi:hypothetical protein BCR42DRAFT_374187 [Absidia repens]|uniref:BZIP domain-containing protein n=1 Tax=Absidia repens TaxID=90262 RepID=A0A1X2IIE1_9FUNG|nr:hypothetical protein BCR42DRAFT_374187 [Absidia repens]